MIDKVQKIREEVVRLKSLIGNNSFLSDYEKGCNDGREDVCDELISIIDSLEEEPISEDLEEAVNVYIGYAPDVVESLSTYVKRLAFKAGAKWQKEQDKETIELAEDHAMLAGMEKMKEQMINKACDWLKNWSYGYLIEKYGETDIDRNELVKDFKKYMED